MADKKDPIETVFLDKSAASVVLLSFAAEKTAPFAARLGYAALGANIAKFSSKVLGPVGTGLFVAQVAADALPVAREYIAFRKAFEKDIHKKLQPLRDGLEDLLASGKLDVKIAQSFIKHYDKPGIPLLRLLQTAKTMETILGNVAAENPAAQQALDLTQQTIRGINPTSDGKVETLYSMLNSIPTDLEDLQKMNQALNPAATESTGITGNPQETAKKPQPPAP